jgi:inner membrane protein involved in colicin E2 resistance
VTKDKPEEKSKEAVSISTTKEAVSISTTKEIKVLMKLYVLAVKLQDTNRMFDPVNICRINSGKGVRMGVTTTQVSVSSSMFTIALRLQILCGSS